MGKLSRFRPSPALVISVIALFVAMGGVGYAAATIGTNDIQNGAVTTPKLAGGAVTGPKIGGSAVGSTKVLNNSLTGTDINESTLGTVPSAASVGGMKIQKFSATPAKPTALTRVATVGNLNLEFGCNASGDPLFTVKAASGAPEQGMKGSFVDGTGTAHSTASGTIPPGGVDVLDGTVLSANGDVNASTADGQVVTVQWSARSSVLAVPGGPNPDPDHCFFYGTAISG
jgi:hypothetical protein